MGGPPTEGTLGAADRAPLRGGAREAALDRGDVRASERCRWFLGRASASRSRMARESGSFQGRVELRASELDRWSRNRHAPNARARRRRTIQPAPSRVHDERCPRRSGWGKALCTSNRGERCPAGESHPGPWPVKPRLGSRHLVTDFGPWQVQRSLASLLERRDATRRANTRGTSWAPPGIRRSAARARGLFWLQKSTSGAWPPRNA
jgi:hypothetical protein